MDDILMEVDTSAYCRLQLPTMTKMLLNAVLEGKWSKNDPTFDKKGCISLAAYYPIDDKERLPIEENNIQSARVSASKPQLPGKRTHNRD